MKAFKLIQTALVGLTLFTFTTSFAEEPAAPAEGATKEAGRDVASKHKGKKKHHGGHSGRKHRAK